MEVSSKTSFPDGRYDEPAMEALAQRLAEVVEPPLVVFLEGDLGAGKTTLTRALVRGLGYRGRVKSPTYGLLEQYEAGGIHVLHLDLYRIADPGELEYLAITDLFGPQTLLVVEWPERGGQFLPAVDLTIHIDHADKARQLRWEPHTPRACRLLEALAEHSR